MILWMLFHCILIVLTLVDIFLVSTVNSEGPGCWITWPLVHMFYCFLNFLFCWFYFFIFSDLNLQNSSIISFSKKILFFIFILSFQAPIMKIITHRFCNNWTFSWNTVFYQQTHLISEIILINCYISWFEKKYLKMKYILKDSCLMK